MIHSQLDNFFFHLISLDNVNAPVRNSIHEKILEDDLKQHWTEYGADPWWRRAVLGVLRDVSRTRPVPTACHVQPPCRHTFQETFCIFERKLIPLEL